MFFPVRYNIEGKFGKDFEVKVASLVAQRVRNLPMTWEGDPGLIPESGRSPGEGNGNPLQYSRLANSMERGAWRAIRQVHHLLPNGLDEPSGPFDKKIGKHFKSPPVTQQL